MRLVNPAANRSAIKMRVAFGDMQCREEVGLANEMSHLAAFPIADLAWSSARCNPQAGIQRVT